MTTPISRVMVWLSSTTGSSRTTTSYAKSCGSRGISSPRRDHQQLRVRAIDVRDLVPDDEWDQLVTANPKVMGGIPVFAGSRVPIEIVLSSLKAGVDIEELNLSYPFLTSAHLEAARVYEQEHPSAGTRASSSRVPSAWKAKSRRVTRRVPKE